MRSFGVKNVDFGGIRSPSRAVRSISATLTGRISTARDGVAGPHRIDHEVDAVLVRTRWWSRPAKRVFQPQPVERPHTVERSRHAAPATARHRSAPTRHSTPSRSIAASVAGPRSRPASLRSNVPVERLDQLVPRDVVVEPVDRLDAQLVGDEFADERERLLGGTGAASPGRLATLVTVGAADPVAVVAVGDQHVVGRDHRGDRVDPHRVGHPFDDVLHAVDGDRGDRLGRLGEQLGEPGRQRQAPHRGQVGAGRTREVEPVGRRLRRDALVGQHTAGALVDDFEAAEHTDDVTVGAGRVGEPHPVDRERRGVVGDEHRPSSIHVLQRVGGPLVPVGPVGFPGDVDVGDVVDAPRPELVEVGVGQHVVRRGDEIVDVPIPVAEGGERGEPGHAPQCHPRAPATATITWR